MNGFNCWKSKQINFNKLQGDRMKRKMILLVIALLLCGSRQILPQAATYSSGNAESLYKELAQAYTVQGKEMSKDEEEKLLKNLSSEMKEKLEEIKKLNKEKYQQLLRSSSYANVFSTGYAQAEGVFGLRGLSEKYRKGQELEIDMELLTLKYKNADKTEQQKLKSDLQVVLNKLFDIRESQKEGEVINLEKRLQELKESLQVRKQKKDEIVQRRIQELLGDSKYLKWD
ncbi:MAG: hypothetical protein C4517_06475 [Stygiobacter sp.]|nr:MAG: hypothetical protein C4517_06475 [Stygiobacter sp.]